MTISVPVARGGRAGLQFEPRDARDRRQRLAAKAKGAEPVEVGGLHELAGRVPLERQQRVVLRHAAAVVLDADERAAAGEELDLDTRGAGVERVLHQLLDHRGRALDDLARGDLVGDPVGKDADGGHDDQGNH